MKRFQRPQSAARFDWPRWTCDAIDGPSGSICGVRASWKELPIAGADFYWLRCDVHRGENAEPIRPDEAFTVTRVELRVAVASLGRDRRRNAIDVTRRIQTLLAGVGAVVIGLRVPGEQASEPTDLNALGRLGLAGPPEGRQDADRPYWGNLASPIGLPWRRRKTG